MEENEGKEVLGVARRGYKRNECWKGGDSIQGMPTAYVVQVHEKDWRQEVVSWLSEVR